MICFSFCEYSYKNFKIKNSNDKKCTSVLLHLVILINVTFTLNAELGYYKLLIKQFHR